MQTAHEDEQRGPVCFTLGGFWSYIVPQLVEKSRGSGRNAACVSGPVGLRATSQLPSEAGLLPAGEKRAAPLEGAEVPGPSQGTDRPLRLLPPLGSCPGGSEGMFSVGVVQLSKGQKH